MSQFIAVIYLRFNILRVYLDLNVVELGGLSREISLGDASWLGLRGFDPPSLNFVLSSKKKSNN